jgi:hypothetical protein
MSSPLSPLQRRFHRLQTLAKGKIYHSGRKNGRISRRKWVLILPNALGKKTGLSG